MAANYIEEKSYSSYSYVLQKEEKAPKGGKNFPMAQLGSSHDQQCTIDVARGPRSCAYQIRSMIWF